MTTSGERAGGTSANFGFLTGPAAYAGDLGAAAEIYAHSDPGAAAVKLRLFGEALARCAAASIGIDLGERWRLDDLIDDLRREGLAQGSVRADFHKLRHGGNEAAHVRALEQPSIDALSLLPIAHRLAVWYHRTFLDSIFVAEYREPRMQKADPRTLQAEASRLVAALARDQRENFESQFADRERRLRQDTERLILAERIAARRAIEDARSASDRALAEARAARSEAAAAAETARRGAAERPASATPDEYELRRQVEAILALERQQHVLDLDRVRQEALRRAGSQRDANDSGAQVRVVTTGGSRKRPRRTWHDAVERPGWKCYYATAGGRLRALDQLGVVASAGVRASLSQVAVFARGPAGVMHGADQRYASGVRLVGQVLRRIVGRGARPPVDPMVEEAINERAGLSDAVELPSPAGELCGTLRLPPELTDLAIQSAALYREPFVLDEAALALDGTSLLKNGEVELLTEGLGGAFGAAAGQWASTRVTATDLLAGESARAAGPWTGTLLTYPLMQPTIVVLDDGDQPLIADGAHSATGVDVDVLRIASQSAVDRNFLAQRLQAAMPPLDEIQPGRRELVLAWGPAVAQRVLLGITEGLERGWLGSPEWRVEVEEPCGIAVAAVRSAVETVSAVAAVWGVDIAPERVVVLCGAERTLLVAGVEGTYVAGETPLSEADIAAGPSVAQLRIRVECQRGPLHVLPERDEVPEVVVRSASLPLDLMEIRPTGAERPRTSSAEAPPAWALRRLLGAIFGKRDFQPEGPAPRGQEIAVRRVLAGLDTVVLLPTGAGKSMIYQLAGLLTPGITLVIDPIIALIDDQVDGLRSNGIDRAVGISSADRASGTIDEKLGQLRSGDAWFVFVAPERLQNGRFRQELRAMAVDTPVSLATVDEAHCVSEWGHDFRPAYLDLGRVLRDIGSDASGTPPPILALTGTASRSVLKDMLVELGVNRADPSIIVRPSSFDRQELRFASVRADQRSLGDAVVQVLRELPDRYMDAKFRMVQDEFYAPRGAASMCGIVFCQTVNGGERSVTAIAADIGSQLRIPAPIYCGSAPNGWVGNFDAEKRTNATAFKASEVPVLIATKAYGMGIDKPNVRFVIHVGAPSSIEAYYQEAGRAGRDRGEAHCILVHTGKDKSTHTWFMDRTYSGIDEDVTQLRSVLKSLMPVGRQRTVTVLMDRDSKAQERAIHRLRVLGIVSDYLVDWGWRRFEVHLSDATQETLDEALLSFVRRSQPGRAAVLSAELAGDTEQRLAHRTMHHARRMVAFVYDTIVAARHRALDEMILLGERGTDDKTIREGILRYLEIEGVAQRLEPLVERDAFTFDDWLPLYEELDSVDEAGEWRGATARFLESEPDHPGLLLGRAIAEVVAPDGDMELYLAEATRAFRSAGTKYGVSPSSRASTLDWLLGWVQRHMHGSAGPILGRTLELAPVALGEGHLDYLEDRERTMISDASCDDALALATVLDRRMSRHHDELLAIDARHRSVVS